MGRSEEEGALVETVGSNGTTGTEAGGIWQWKLLRFPRNLSSNLPLGLSLSSIFIFSEYYNVDIRRGAWNNAEVRRWAAQVLRWKAYGTHRWHVGPD